MREGREKTLGPRCGVFLPSCFCEFIEQEPPPSNGHIHPPAKPRQQPSRTAHLRATATAKATATADLASDQTSNITTGLNGYSDFPELYPYPLYFEPGGLIPFGHNFWGDTLFWLTTTSTIDDWPLVVIEGRNGNFHARYDLPLTRFLLDTFAGHLHCPLLPDDWHQHPPTFDPR